MTHVICCPVCEGPMKEIERENVMIDVCLRCRGFWLDHGELERIISSCKNAPNTCLIQEKPRKERKNAPRSRHNAYSFYDDDDDVSFDRGYVPQERKSHKVSSRGA